MRLLLLSTLALLFTIACTLVLAQQVIAPPAVEGIHVQGGKYGGEPSLTVRWTEPTYELRRLGVEIYNSTRDLRRASSNSSPSDKPPIWFLEEKPQLKAAGCPLGAVGIILTDKCLSKFQPVRDGTFPNGFIKSGGNTYAPRWESPVRRITLGQPGSVTPTPTRPTLHPTYPPTPTPTPTPIATGATPIPRIPTPTPTPSTYRDPEPPLTLGDMIVRVRPSIVKVTNSIGQGSGVIFKTEGGNAYVVTNQHVVGHDTTVNITVKDTSTTTTSYLVG